jgi:hypothetical protein
MSRLVKWLDVGLLTAAERPLPAIQADFRFWPIPVVRSACQRRPWFGQSSNALRRNGIRLSPIDNVRQRHEDFLSEVELPT